MPEPSVLVLGSRSPRRLALLSLLVPRARIVVRPPADSREAGFDGLDTDVEIEQRVRQIARDKNTSVLQECGRDLAGAAILTADTVIVGTAEEGTRVVLGQPPEDGTWQDVVRGWFHTFYAGR